MASARWQCRRGRFGLTASQPKSSRRHCSGSILPKCLPTGSASTMRQSRTCVGTASSDASAGAIRRNPVLYSIDRILTIHAGSLPRPPDLWEMVAAKANDEPYDQDKYDERLKSAVAEVVRRQAECGIDCVND